MRYYRARQEDDDLDGDQEDEELSGYRKTHQDQGGTESIRQRHQRHRWAGGRSEMVTRSCRAQDNQRCSLKIMPSARQPEVFAQDVETNSMGQPLPPIRLVKAGPIGSKNDQG
jgi:hypothetical protein